MKVILCYLFVSFFTFGMSDEPCFRHRQLELIQQELEDEIKPLDEYDMLLAYVLAHDVLPEDMRLDFPPGFITCRHK